MNSARACILTCCVLLLAVAMGQSQEPLPFPSPTQSVVATPVPEDAVGPIPFRPPLSIIDVGGSLADLQRHLEHAPAVTSPEKIDPSVLRLLDSASAYLQQREDLQGAISEYRWGTLDRAVVTHPDASSQMIMISPPETRISALGLEVRGADVEIQSVRVFNEDGTEIQGYRNRPESAWILLDGIPRRSVYHLWQRTEVSRVEIRWTMLHATPAPATVAVTFGKNDSREYGKMAIHQVLLAREELSRGEVGTARETLLEAQTLLRRHMERTIGPGGVNRRP